MELTEKDKSDILRAFTLLINRESDTVDYSNLLLKLGINCKYIHTECKGGLDESKRL